MTTDLAEIDIDQGRVLQSLGINVNDPRSQAVMLVSKKYNLAPELKHVMVIQNAPYITKSGYLHIAHRSGVFDGIEILEEKETEKQCSARVAVYRKDMARPFVTSARFNKSDAKGRDPMDMALARATRRGLQQAFDVADIFGNADHVDEVDLAEGAAAPVAQWQPPQLTQDSVPGSQVATQSEAGAVVGSIPATSVGTEIIDDTITGPEILDKFTKSMGAQAAETGEIADEFTRKRLLELVGQFDEEQLEGFKRDWKKAGLGGLNDSAEKKLLTSQADQAERLINSKLIAQNDVYERRRKHVNSMMSELGIKGDDERHAFISEATDGETESTKALLGRQVKVITELVSERATDQGDEMVMFPGDVDE